jgi:hypothetical protein
VGWKTINGRRYFYKSEREGVRVKTTYLGAGESGLLISLLESEDRELRDAEHKQRRAELEESELEEKSIGDWFDGILAVADAAMIAAGFHKHKGQGRRRRK